jgi:hypothetical protein
MSCEAGSDRVRLGCRGVRPSDDKKPGGRVSHKGEAVTA